MRSGLRSGSWTGLVVSTALAVFCFGGDLYQPALVSAKTSVEFLDLVSMLSGNFSNEEQVKQERASGQPALDDVSGVFLPVRVALFAPWPTLFHQEVVKGKIVRRDILVGRDQNSQGLIHLELYNLKTPLPTDPWTIDSYSLETLTMDELEHLEGCDPSLYKINDRMYFGEWPECHNYSPENHRVYPMLVTCDQITTMMLVGNNYLEKSSHVPYIFKASERYPLLPYSYAMEDNYKNPCL